MKSGTTLRLTCPIEPDPTLLVEWMKDGHVIRPGWDNRYRLMAPPTAVDGGTNSSSSSFVAAAAVLTLRIRDVAATDSGLFVCLATNGFGSVEVSFDVNVIRE